MIVTRNILFVLPSNTNRIDSNTVLRRRRKVTLTGGGTTNFLVTTKRLVVHKLPRYIRITSIHILRHLSGPGDGTNPIPKTEDTQLYPLSPHAAYHVL